MKIANDLNLSAVDYANQGNSIIGIRDSGKTYTATKIAEELMRAGISIIAFDPIIADLLTELQNQGFLTEPDKWIDRGEVILKKAYNF